MDHLLAIPEPGTTALLVLIMFASAVLQTTTGFGFAILSAPVLTAVFGGPEAVSTIIICGTAVDVLILLVRRTGSRRAAPREVAVLVLSSVPGLVLGAWLLSVLPQRALLLVVAAAVVLAVAHRVLQRRAPRASRPVSWGWGAAAGFASGTLGTSTTLAGPPTVLYLTRRLSDPSSIRDTLVAVNLVRAPISVAALLAAGTFAVPAGIVWPALAACAGYLLGSRLFGRLDAARYESLVLSALVLAAAVAVASAFL
ncbi:sulfite exporter TauE/SafE family protein [Mycetocola reblochoni]|uniref:Probable membrane transporter protein n=2 Tax=Mycetocola reblochoni TaxID=331618 RepID=A0A1R4KCZ5_9MICO|nr:sulfite exporter TauE/SafE family protein [Mycetocola reblochoni]RLP69277.1 sulfite exporter TauE/SafE family protein [Mycetocola reblochoni]SJN42042.1 hypothetical protein FM119_13045 [Mycetocola reblochoni REB411]